MCSGKPRRPPQALPQLCPHPGPPQPCSDTHEGRENSRTCRVSKEQNRLLLFEDHDAFPQHPCTHCPVEPSHPPSGAPATGTV